MTSRGAEKMTPSTIGIDISKDHLDTYRMEDGARALPDHVESRDRKGIAQFQRRGACPYRKSRATFSGHAQAAVSLMTKPAIRP